MYYFFEIAPGNVAYTKSKKVLPAGKPYVKSNLPDKPDGDYILAIQNGVVKWVPEPKPEVPELTPLEVLQQENKLLKAQIQAQSTQLDLLEDCIVEMAMQVYE